MSARQTAVRWLKFNAIGGMGIIVQLATLGVLTHGLDLNYLLGTALAVEAAVFHNFLWHEQYTWADRATVSARESIARFLRFNLTTGVFSILGNVALMWLFAGLVGLSYLLANLITVATCSVINFLVSDRFVFRGTDARPA